MKLDKYEQELLDAYDQGKLKSRKLSKKELSEYQLAAKATFAKDKRVNIRISSNDLRSIQIRALEEGIPYQTLMASVLHKFVGGRLVDKGA